MLTVWDRGCFLSPIQSVWMFGNFCCLELSFYRVLGLNSRRLVSFFSCELIGPSRL